MAVFVVVKLSFLASRDLDIYPVCFVDSEWVDCINGEPCLNWLLRLSWSDFLTTLFLTLIMGATLRLSKLDLYCLSML